MKYRNLLVQYKGGGYGGCYGAAMPGRHLGKRIQFKALPLACQKLVLADLRDA